MYGWQNGKMVHSMTCMIHEWIWFNCLVLNTYRNGIAVKENGKSEIKEMVNLLNRLKNGLSVHNIYLSISDAHWIGCGNMLMPIFVCALAFRCTESTFVYISNAFSIVYACQCEMRTIQLDREFVYLWSNWADILYSHVNRKNVIVIQYTMICSSNGSVRFACQMPTTHDT